MPDDFYRNKVEEVLQLLIENHEAIERQTKLMEEMMREFMDYKKSCEKK